MKNPRSPRNHRPQIIDFVPAGSARASATSAARRIERLAASAFKIALGVLIALVVVRVADIFLFRGEIAEGAGRVAIVGGFSEGVSGWLTGSVTFIIAIAAFGFVVRLALAFFLPAVIGGSNLWRPAVALLCLTGFNALGPEAIKAFRGVDDAGFPARMTEVDPASAFWFDPDGNALVFYADHLDGERRYWDRPGHTPEDSAIASPVSAEIRRGWLEKNRGEAEQAQLRETRKSEEAKLETARKELEKLTTSLAREKASQESARDSSPRRTNSNPVPASTRPTNAADLVSVGQFTRAVPVPSLPAVQSHQLRLESERTLAVELGGRAAECWADGSIEVWTASHSRGAAAASGSGLVIGPGQKRRIEGAEVLYIQPVNQFANTLHVRWLDGSGRAPAPASRSLAPVPAAIPVVTPTLSPARLEPPVQTIPITRGRVTHVNVHGDTVDCWSDGPVAIVGDRSSGSVRNLRSGERVRISGSERVNVTPVGNGATRFFIQTAAPNLDRFRSGQPESAPSSDRHRFARF